MPTTNAARLAMVAILMSGLAGTAHAQVPDRESAAEQAIDLEDWSYAPLYEDGWSAEAVIDSPAYDQAGEEIGRVAEIAVTFDGEIAGLVIESNGLFDGDWFALPWDAVEFGPGGRVTVPVAEGNLDVYRIDESAIDVDEDVWRVTELLGDQAFFGLGKRYGVIGDAIFGTDGQLYALIVSEADGILGAFALPYTPAGWNRSAEAYLFPYATEEIADLERFDPGRLSGEPS